LWHRGWVPLAELSGEPLVHYNPDNGNALWVDQFAARRGVVLPQPTLRTGSPRTAAQLAAAGMGVAVVPFSALTPRPGGTVRAVDPPGVRAAIVILAPPRAYPLRPFVSDLRRRGLPDSRMSPSTGLGPGLPGPRGGNAGRRVPGRGQRRAHRDRRGLTAAKVIEQARLARRHSRPTGLAAMSVQVLGN